MTITIINYPLREATKVINEPSASSNSKWSSFIYTEFFHLIKMYSINIRIVLNRLLNVRVQCFQIVFFLMRWRLITFCRLNHLWFKINELHRFICAINELWCVYMRMCICVHIYFIRSLNIL
jgi:hypothetical protein